MVYIGHKSIKYMIYIVHQNDTLIATTVIIL